MKSKSYSGYLSVVVAGLLLGLVLKKTLTEIWHQPAVFVEPTVFDFGQVGTGQVYTAVYAVENRGRAPLEVRLLKANCMCTVAEMCQNPILPGRQSQVKARIKAPDAEAPFGSELAIETNDPRHPQINLQMRGTAASVLSITPNPLLIADVHVRDLPLTKTITIRPGRLARLGVLAFLGVACDHPSLCLNVVKDANQVLVDVTLSRDVPIGAVRTEVVFKINDDSNYTLAVPVVCQVRGDYNIVPASLFFGKVEAGTLSATECHVAPFGANDRLELISGEADIAEDPLRVEIVRSTDRALIRGIFSAGIQKNVFERTLTFKLTPAGGSPPQYLQVPAIAITSTPQIKSNVTAKQRRDLH